MKCIASSDPYLIGRDISRDTLKLQGYRYVYIRDRFVHAYVRGNVYIELSNLTFAEGMDILERGN